MGSIVEENSDHNSFGFRLRRDIGDVIQQLIIFLDKPYGATKILDADISKCFEKIDHNAILKDGFQIIGFWIQKRKYHVDVFRHFVLNKGINMTQSAVIPGELESPTSTLSG